MNPERIEDFVRLRNSIRKSLISFPENSRQDILFGIWNLKDVIAHLNNWMVHDIECLTALKENRIPYWEPDIDEFNKRGTEERKTHTWDQLITEFDNLSDNLLNIYQTYPASLVTSKIWPDYDETPEKFLEEDISHWSEELANINFKNK